MTVGCHRRSVEKARDVCGKGCEYHVDCPLEIDIDVKVRIGKGIDVGGLSCDMKNDVWLYFLYDRKYLIFVSYVLDIEGYVFGNKCFISSG